MTASKLDQILDEAERLGVVGSPSSTAELAMDVLGTAVDRKLVGELALFRYVQDAAPHYALGQITEVLLRNPWHEDPTMRSLIRQRGRVDAVSERQDTHLAQMTVSAVFQERGQGRYEPSLLGTVPSTGTRISLVSDGVLDVLLKPYAEQIVYLGQVYASTPKLPMWFKHFGSDANGAGEAYHLGIFGKSGSGKSVLAKLVLLGYARHRDMGIIVIDPQGEFARDLNDDIPEHEGMRLPMREIYQHLGKRAVARSVSTLVLDTWALFEEILFESRFFFSLTMPKGDNRRDACREVVGALRKGKVKLTDLIDRKSFDLVWAKLQDQAFVKVFYRTPETQQRFIGAVTGGDADTFFNDLWSPVARLFDPNREGARPIQKALNWVLEAKSDGSPRPVLILDLSEQAAGDMLWNDRIQALVIKRVLDGIATMAEQRFKERSTLNTLVLIDEAHRLAPREISDDDAAQRVRSTLIDAVRTTRKYGLGWMFISQTLASLHREIIQQLRIMFFGFGLSLGQEYVSLQQLVGTGGPSLDLYRLFRDPHAAFDARSRQYSFMTIGPVSPLSFAGTPLFLSVFNSPEAFLRANPVLEPERVVS